MSNRKLLMRMFKEIIKHSEKDDCYYCYRIVRELNLKKKLEEMQRESECQK